METQSNVWEQTVKVLARVSSTDKCCDAPDVLRDDSILHDKWRKRAVECGIPPSAYVSILERTSRSVVWICWCDATTGRYGEQCWKLRSSRSRSVCALSGATIHRGDPIYKPYARGRSPGNVCHVILAEALEKLEQGLAARNTSDNDEVPCVRDVQQSRIHAQPRELHA
ncbi:DUF3331 domain-containing protein [Paraburkholderia sp. DHOC27]|uniref:DUF3331 domain-containing protein n=1 Tax=Paraburkholderia sp. DHOC27 TaxID=2303330 RepID=UPI000E3CC4FB|nr:DUF3331 domain-containing protein [Paraburkholderia sp. DHOC27]RFU49202.1 DUF3331 domain-containing protein [Paraburkholderia sp. DHOC27]